MGVRAGEPRGPISPVKQPLRHLGEARPRRPEAQHQVVVLGPFEVAVPAHVRDGVRPHEVRGGRERALDEDLPRDIVGAHRRVQPRLVAARAVADLAVREVRDHAAAERERGIGLHEGVLGAQALGLAHVVGVHAREVTPGRRGAPALESRDDARGILPQHTHTGIAGTPTGEYPRRVVRGAVVDRDDFEIAEPLCLERADGLVEVRRPVTHRQQDGDGRGGGHR